MGGGAVTAIVRLGPQHHTAAACSAAQCAPPPAASRPHLAAQHPSQAHVRLPPRLAVTWPCIRVPLHHAFFRHSLYALPLCPALSSSSPTLPPFYPPCHPLPPPHLLPLPSRVCTQCSRMRRVSPLPLGAGLQPPCSCPRASAGPLRVASELQGGGRVPLSLPLCWQVCSRTVALQRVLERCMGARKAGTSVSCTAACTAVVAVGPCGGFLQPESSPLRLGDPWTLRPCLGAKCMRSLIAAPSLPPPLPLHPSLSSLQALPLPPAPSASPRGLSSASSSSTTSSTTTRGGGRATTTCSPPPSRSGWRSQGSSSSSSSRWVVVVCASCCVRACVRVCVHACVHACVCARVCVSVRVHVCGCVCVCVCVFVLSDFVCTVPCHSWASFSGNPLIAC